MGDCCYKFLYRDNNQINIIKQKRGISNPNYYQKKKENKFSSNSSINNGIIKRENSLDSKKLNNNLQGQSKNNNFEQNYHFQNNNNYNQKKKIKLKSEKESEIKIKNINSINNFNKGKTEYVVDASFDGGADCSRRDCVHRGVGPMVDD